MYEGVFKAELELWLSVSNTGFLMQSEEEEEDDEEQPLNLEWPDTTRKQVMYLFIFPIVFPLWLTLPDVRRNVRNSSRIPILFTDSKLSKAYLEY